MVRLHHWARAVGRVLVLVPLFAAAAWGPSSIEVRVVQSASETPVSGAHVALARPGGAPIQSARTETAGTFRFVALEPGDYQLRVEAEGFLAIAYDLAVRPRQPLILTVELAPRRAGATQEEVRALAPGIDPGETGSSRWLTRAGIEELPAPMSRSLPTLIQQMAPCSATTILSTCAATKCRCTNSSTASRFSTTRTNTSRRLSARRSLSR